MVDTSIQSTGQKTPASSAPKAAKPQAAPEAAGTGDALVPGGADTATPAETAQVAAPATSVPLSSKVSGLATYRDSESGRLVIQIFDQKRGDVIIEFPSENMLRGYPTASAAPSLDHVVETKA